MLKVGRAVTGLQWAQPLQSRAVNFLLFLPPPSILFSLEFIIAIMAVRLRTVFRMDDSSSSEAQSVSLSDCTTAAGLVRTTLPFLVDLVVALFLGGMLRFGTQESAADK